MNITADSTVSPSSSIDLSCPEYSLVDSDDQQQQPRSPPDLTCREQLDRPRQRKRKRQQRACVRAHKKRRLSPDCAVDSQATMNSSCCERERTDDSLPRGGLSPVSTSKLIAALDMSGNDVSAACSALYESSFSSDSLTVSSSPERVVTQQTPAWLHAADAPDSLRAAVERMYSQRFDQNLVLLVPTCGIEDAQSATAKLLSLTNSLDEHDNCFRARLRTLLVRAYRTTAHAARHAYAFDLPGNVWTTDMHGLEQQTVDVGCARIIVDATYVHVACTRTLFDVLESVGAAKRKPTSCEPPNHINPDACACVPWMRADSSYAAVKVPLTVVVLTNFDAFV